MDGSLYPSILIISEMTPEAEARQTIDSMLEASGWQIQNYTEHATDASLGIAVREYPLEDEQSADYLLFISVLRTFD